MDRRTETMGFTLIYSFLGILEYVFSYFVMIDNSPVNDFIIYPFAFIVLFLKVFIKKEIESKDTYFTVYLTFARHCHVDFQKEFLSLILVELPYPV